MTINKSFYTPEVDQHIGQRIQLRRNMMGLSQKNLAGLCGVTFQQIQKYESAGNRISASRLFNISTALETPVSFFFQGLPGNIPDSKRAKMTGRLASPKKDDPLEKNESLNLIKLYWKLPTDEQREVVMKMLQSLNGMDKKD